MKEVSVVFLHDSEAVRIAASKTLRSRGYRVTPASDPQEAVRRFAESAPDLVILSELAAGMPQTLTWLGEILRCDARIRVMLAPSENLPMMDVHSAAEANPGPRSMEREIVGESCAMIRLRNLLSNVGPSHAGVLITGETGTGKELVACEIHRRSARRGKRFVAINCAAVPDSLLESELFGVERGAYTGAHACRDGKLQTANGGTLFLDELSELSLVAQAKLLRAIETQQVERLGGGSATQLDVRVIAATNQNLLDLVAQGRFRRDLFYRLAVCQIQIPPLRERMEDIPMLAAHLLEKLQNGAGSRITGLAPETAALLQRHDWPGNVRELRNVLEAVTVEKMEGSILPSDLPSWFLSQALSNKVVGGRQELVAALEKVGWNKSRAARELQCSRVTLYRRMAKHKIDGGAKPQRQIHSVTGGASPRRPGG